MKDKRLLLRARADRDIQEAVRYYLREGGAKVATALVDALEQAFQQIRRSPAAGAPRYAHGLDLPGLRHWPVKSYPYLIFYVEEGDAIDVWRVLHSRRDLPAWLASDDE